MTIQGENFSRGLLKVDHFGCVKERLPVRPVTIPLGNNYIEIVTSGVVYFRDNGVRKKYTAGAMFWHVGGEKTIHETDPDNPYRCYAFHLTGYESVRQAPRITRWLPLVNVKAFGKECLEAFHSDCTNKVFLADYVYATLLYRATAPQASAISYPPILTAALSFVNDNLQREVTIEDVAKEVSISKPYLFALFKEHLHCSPYQYMLNQRINHAKAMLCSENAPIKGIAALCCFNNLEVFYRQFKKCTGMTPLEYRNKYK